jgi:voltage-gated potassium channel
MIPGTRSFRKFLNDPSSLRYATASIITLTALLVLIGAVLMRVFDHDEYPTFGSALWFTLQTVTTVGYGDDTPTSGIGRLVASGVMLVSIGLITVVTAVITSLFIQSARRLGGTARNDGSTAALARIEASLAAAHERLDQIERTTAISTGATASAEHAGDDPSNPST